MQFDPIKPTLKPPRIERLELQYDGTDVSFCSNFKSRHYDRVECRQCQRWRRVPPHVSPDSLADDWQGLTLVHIGAQVEQLHDTFMT